MTSNKFRGRKIRIEKMNDILKGLFPDAKIALNFSSNWELLVAVVLSAQCTDKMVNKVTEKLFEKYKTLEDYVRAGPDEFEQDIRSTGFYRNKAKNILAAAKKIKEEFGGKVPDAMEELLTIPGVARKSASVILGNAFGKSEGIAVDTHVRRFAIRFDLSDYTDPVRIERDLMTLLPKREWNTITYRLIDYGRAICPARKHDCGEHPLTKIYPLAANRWPKAK
ncbi:endonuclease III [Candidatus Wolfebacteria bacterium]|nr:endonuclease III [Candidatus Wolfebacteria bacterium]